MQCIERIAPPMLQEDYDNSGLQTGDPTTPVSRVLITLDVTEATVDEARAIGAQLIVSHHPLLFRPVKHITTADYIGRTLLAAIRAGVALYAAHTNLDNADGGVNYQIARRLGLTDPEPLVPLRADKAAMLPADKARRCGTGIIGTLPEAMSETDFIARVRERFECDCLRHNRTAGHSAIRRVALCGGAGSSFIGAALARGADAYLTGEVGYHPFFGHPEMLILEAGHYETEQYTCELLQDIIRQSLPHIECRLSTATSPVAVN